MRFSTGEHWVSWCHDCPCGTVQAADGISWREYLEGRDYASLSLQAAFGGVEPPRCAAASALLHSRGFQILNLFRQFSAAAMAGGSIGDRRRGTSGNVIIPVQLSSGRSSGYTAVGVQPGQLTSFGVVKPATKGGVTCVSCGQRHCRHTAAYRGLQQQQQQQGQGQGQQQEGQGQQQQQQGHLGRDQQQQPHADGDSYMAPPIYEGVLKEFFDFSSGQRKLKCISQYRVPRSANHDQHVRTTIHQRTSGRLPLPNAVFHRAFSRGSSRHVDTVVR